MTARPIAIAARRARLLDARARRAAPPRRGDRLRVRGGRARGRRRPTSSSVVIADVFLGGDALATSPLRRSRSSRCWPSSARRSCSPPTPSPRPPRGRVKRRLRADLTAHLFALGPAWTGARADRRAGRRSSPTGSTTSTRTVTSFQPARALAVAVPLLVLGVVLVLDPPTAARPAVHRARSWSCSSALIGGRARAITDRRFAELRWLSAFFLDMLHGPRDAQDVRPERRAGRRTSATISRQYGDTTMEVLRTAFQTSLVLEWGGAVAVALVAVEISLRLMAGAIEFERALAVLIIVPEFFLPLRHAGDALPRGCGRAGRGRARVRDPRRAGAADGRRAAAGPPRRAAPRPAPRRHPVRAASRSRYPGRTAPALDGLDLTIPPRGPRRARRGDRRRARRPSRSLLLRFIEPDAGDDPGRRTCRSPTIDLAAWRRARRLGPAAAAPVPRHGRRQPPARPARRRRRRPSARRPARPGADAFIDALPAGLRHAGRRGRRSG